MRDRIDAYARKLEGLSTMELSRGAEKLVASQRLNDAALIAHLAEMSRRKGHLELGYKSLFAYCQEHLRLGENQVWLRTQVAGVARRFPQVLEHLAEGKVSLSVLAILAPHLSDENVDDVLKEAEGKTTRQAKEIVAALRPKPTVEPAIRRKPRPKRTASSGRGDGVLEEARGPAVLPGKLEVARPEVYNFRFSGGKGLKEKIERLAEVLGIADSTGRMPELIEEALDLALEKKDPRRKLERRRKREARRATGSAGDSPASSRTPPPCPHEARRDSERTSEASSRSRYIPGSVRVLVLERASYQCEFGGPGGVRCTARAGLQIDHIEP